MVIYRIIWLLTYSPCILFMTPIELERWPKTAHHDWNVVQSLLNIHYRPKPYYLVYWHIRHIYFMTPIKLERWPKTAHQFGWYAVSIYISIKREKRQVRLLIICNTHVGVYWQLVTRKLLFARLLPSVKCWAGANFSSEWHHPPSTLFLCSAPLATLKTMCGCIVLKQFQIRQSAESSINLRAETHLWRLRVTQVARFT